MRENLSNGTPKFPNVTHLVICIDRDDDLGFKTGIKTPVIGRDKNLEAATKLALEDPTEADSNTIFSAIKVYDELRYKGIDAEIVSVSGDQSVGIVSDRKIAQQLDELLDTFKVENATVVTDGADDEFILPLIHSRMKIDYVHRNIVVQSQALESAYYQMKKALSDPKFSRMIFVPIGIIFLVYGIFLLAGYPQGAVIVIFIFMGAYALLRGLGWGYAVEDFTGRLERFFYEGRFSFIVYVIAAIIAAVGTIVAVTEVLDFYNPKEGYLIIVNSNLSMRTVILSMYISYSVWWYMTVVLMVIFGRTMNRYIEEKATLKSLRNIFFTLSAGLVLWGGSGYVLSLGGVAPTHQYIALRILLFSIIGAVLISALGILISRYGARKVLDK